MMRFPTLLLMLFAVGQAFTVVGPMARPLPVLVRTLRLRAVCWQELEQDASTVYCRYEPENSPLDIRFVPGLGYVLFQ